MPTAAELHYYFYEGSTEGAVPPVILIHGAGGNHLYWHPHIRRLPNNRVYALDLPGHGKSSGRGHQTISAYCDSILDWMEAVSLYSAIFVGHSMGSAIALMLALDHPKHVLGLGLVGAGARLPVNAELIKAAASPTTYHQAIDNIVKWSFSPDTPSQLTDQAAKRMAEIRPSVLHGDFLACNAFDETQRLSRIYKPTIILCGALDKMTPPRFSQYLADNISNSQLEIIPHAGHMLMLEQPDKVADALLDFLPSIHY
jgi:pimeloyl-ACP methyl ester carboxylesterase